MTVQLPASLETVRQNVPRVWAERVRQVDPDWDWRHFHTGHKTRKRRLLLRVKSNFHMQHVALTDPPNMILMASGAWKLKQIHLTLKSRLFRQVTNTGIPDKPLVVPLMAGQDVNFLVTKHVLIAEYFTKTKAGCFKFLSFLAFLQCALGFLLLWLLWSKHTKTIFRFSSESPVLWRGDSNLWEKPGTRLVIWAT